ncbi:uncharacterized protein LOC121007870 [Bufo bufo]|uniref:uncharacterized protein LOC121007870 n=1 Tax=Bufo bufo TaxID=8384 RepID=UPI001ABDFA52|nr:uncharacterized protein LOC121007870 [Bufo bufo]
MSDMRRWNPSSEELTTSQLPGHSVGSLVAIILHRLQPHRIVSKMAQSPQDIRQRINQFTTGNVLGYNRVALQVFGMLGHGKSSLINSSVSVVKDEEYENVAGAGLSDGGMTISRHEHELTDALVMIDNRGFQKLMWEEIVEACAQLRSLREVTWEKDNLEVTLEQLPHKYTDRPKDFILPVLVYSAISALGEADMANMEKLITNTFRVTGIHPIVVITKCSSDKIEEVKKKFGNLGVMKRICLENYTENNFERTEEKDQKILEFVNMCIQEAERGLKMRQNEDPQTRFITQAIQQVKLESDILRKKIIPPRKKKFWLF